MRRAAWIPRDAEDGVEILRPGVERVGFTVESGALEELRAEEEARRMAWRVSDDIGEREGQGRLRTEGRN